jgi:alpha-mannosidase
MKRTVAVCVVLAGLAARGWAAEGAVWSIGRFDKSSEEFRAPVKEKLVFRAGQGDWRKDWPGFQRPGQVSEIDFGMEAPAAGGYTLEVSILTWTPRIPALAATINGHRGLFYLQPKVNEVFGDGVFAFDPHYSISKLQIGIPASYLKRGENVLALEPVDEPAEKGTGARSGFAWDALRLMAGMPKDEARARVEPTIFYRAGAGGLKEVVDVVVRPEAGARGKVRLELGGHSYEAELAGADFGEQRFSFEVPEWSGTETARVTAGGGRTDSFPVTAAKKWTVYVAPHTHLDVGYTDYQGKVAETQARVLEQAGQLIEEHPAFRFSMDGSWNLEQLLDTRSEGERKKILGLIREGKMAMPAQYANLLTGYASLETLYRSLYVAKGYARAYGLPFEYANITDVPSYSGAYPSVLAAAGVKYFVAASNNDRAPVFAHEPWNSKSPFWWEGPDGKKILFWYSRHYEQVETLFGLPPSLNAVRESLPIYLQAYSGTGYKLDSVLLYGTQVENTDLYPSTATFVGEWDGQYAYPHLEYTTFPKFFEEIASKYGAGLPVYKGDGGPYWEDGAGSDALYTAEDRENQRRALSAEVLSSAMHSVQPELHAPVAEMADIWRHIVLFSEHTWTSYNSVSQPDHEEAVRQLAVKDNHAVAAHFEIGDVMDRGLSQLANDIHVPAETLVVFNPLNWQRDALVETDLGPDAGLEDLTTQERVAYQVSEAKEKFIRVRFLARGLPAVGYKCYAITREKRAEPAAAVETSVENRHYRVTVDAASGAVKSIYDKELRRELVDERSPYKFGQYVYVSGGDGTSMIHPVTTLPRPHLVVDLAGKGKLVAMEKTPFGESVRMVSEAKNTPRIETEMLLFDGAKKIEFRYRVKKDAVTAKEAVYFAFPVAAARPSFAFALQQGWIDPAKDVWRGGSLEWFTVQDWMEAGDDGLHVGVIPVDAPLASFGDINRGEWPAEFHPKSATMFSYAMNNYWHTNYRAAQGGEFTFRYVVTSAGALDAAALTRLSEESMRPAEVNHVVSQDKPGNPDRPLPAEGTGFLVADAKDVVLETWKRAEDGNGSILRLRETAGKAATVRLRFPHGTVREAELCDGVEDAGRGLKMEGGAVEVPVGAFEVVTVRVR